MMTKQSLRRFLFAGLFTLLICCMFRGSGQTAQAEDTTDRNLVIEVVEDIPAEEIEEQAVPLAALPDSPQRSNVRHSVLAGIFLACVLGYFLYFRNFKRRLRVLRETAERYGYEMLKNRRSSL